MPDAASGHRFWKRLRLPVSKAVDDLTVVADHFNATANRLEAENRRTLDAMIEDENRLRKWKLTVMGTDGEKHAIPLRCSRNQIRKVKLAIFNADGDALAVER